MKRFAILLFGLMCAAPVAAEVTGTEVTYHAGDTTLKGYLATDPAQKGPRPGILVVHEWWGQNGYARKRARMLAELGYTALALDMYGNGKTADHPDDAGKFSGELRKNMPVAKARFLAALKLLQSQPNVEADKIAAIGYCFGGGVVLEMARRGVDLKGVVSFHGSLGTAQPAQAGEVKAKVLVLNGADDPFTKPEQITAFKQEMHDAGADLRFINYPGAKHSFTNPQADIFGQRFKLPLQYNEQADRQSWAEMQRFFKRIFQKD
jgi:dienelactone hydrolase